VARPTESAVGAGREAVARFAWREGFDLFTEADSQDGGLSAEDLERLGEAAWWTGRLDACIAARERAFASYMQEENVGGAAMVAIALAKDYYAKGSPSIGSGWVSRAERLLAEEPESVEHGWLERLRAVLAHEGAGDYEKAIEHGRRALDLATQFGSRELQAIALHDQGRALVASGRVADGMALIDEATVAAVSGELRPYDTGVIYCNTITACKELADYRRAGDWTEAAKRWCDRQAIAGFPGMCRVYRASIMLVQGAWPEAEVEARRACDELQEFNLSYAAEAFYELGAIRMRAGDLAAAENAFKQAHELGRDPQPGLALLRLAEGKTQSARSCVDRALADESRELYRARLLPAEVEIAVVQGDLDRARAAADELDAIASTYGSDALGAAAASAQARVARADGDASRAVRESRQALRRWQAVDAPYEAAETRMLLASAYVAEGDPDSAVLELEAARAALERLGAANDVRKARERLRDLGIETLMGPDGRGRATRTFMFTDVVRSTNLVEAVGDEAWTDIVRWHDETLRSLFANHGGEEVDHAGDGFFVAFADSPAAIECAVAIQRKLAEHRRRHGFAPQVRIGVHTAEASRHGSGYKGRGVHAASRIAALAVGGEIVASRTAVEDEGGRFATSEPRAVRLKGIEKPVEVISIGWR
jgi:class 3 adenylate cyclase